MSIRVAEAMTSEAEVVSADLPLTELDRRFIAQRRGGFPVVDADGRVVGIVSRSDVVRQLCVEQSNAEYAGDSYYDVAGRPSAEDSLEDLATRVGRSVQNLKVRDVMIGDVIVISSRDLLADVARLFVQHHIHRAPVVDDGKLVGVLTTLDITRLLAEGRLGEVARGASQATLEESLA